MTSNKCPVEGAHELHEDMKRQPLLWNSLIDGGLIFAYYSCPDFIRSKFGRFIVKSGVETALAANLYHQEPEIFKQMKNIISSSAQKVEDPWEEDEEAMQVDQSPNRIAILFSVVVAALGLGVLGERLIYRRAQKKAAAGVKYPHTKQAAVIALLFTTASVAIDKYAK